LQVTYELFSQKYWYVLKQQARNIFKNVEKRKQFLFQRKTLPFDIFPGNSIKVASTA